MDCVLKLAQKGRYQSSTVTLGFCDPMQALTFALMSGRETADAVSNVKRLGQPARLVEFESFLGNAMPAQIEHFAKLVLGSVRHKDIGNAESFDLQRG